MQIFAPYVRHVAQLAGKGAMGVNDEWLMFNGRCHILQNDNN